MSARSDINPSSRLRRSSGLLAWARRAPRYKAAAKRHASGVMEERMGLDGNLSSGSSRLALPLLYGVSAAAVGGCVLWFGPPGVDLAAHLYQRALFLQHGFSFWNNFWYAGRYSYVTYSLLYYPIAAVTGIKALAVVSVAVGAAAFGIAVEREWGSSARSAAWVFAVVLAGSLLLAAFPYTLGLAFALLSIVALQAGRFRVFGALVVATFTASPLAFLMLVVLLSAAFVRSRRFLWQAGLPVLATAGLGALLWRLFPGAGRFPFSLTDLAAVLLFCGLGLALTEGVEHAGLLFALFGIYALTSVLCYVVPSEIGSNVGRLRYVAVPVAILTLSLRRWKPLIPALAAFALALSWNVTPLIASVERSSEDPSASKAYWLPVIRFLHEHLSPNYRVEAVATAGHWEATYLPSAGIPIVRGWFRQDDFPSDALLYTPRLAPRAYVGWLDRMGARYVVLTDAPPDYSSRAEEILLRSRATHLPVVYRTAEITIFEVPSSTPILTGPARPRIVALNNNGLVLDLHGPGTYRLAVSYTPYWSAPGACVERGADGMVTLTTRHAGLVRVGFGFDVPRALAAIEGTTTDCSSKGAPS